MPTLDITIKVKVSRYFKLLGLFGKRFRLFAVMYLLPEHFVVHRVCHDGKIIDIQRIGDLKARIRIAKAKNR